MKPNTEIPTIADKRLQFCCPNCGSKQVHKSIGGNVEHAAAWGATKLIKSAILGDYSSFTGGVENEIIKEGVPFQQVCDYCHRTFHASKCDIDSGKYSMFEEKANRLANTYNQKLQRVKDDEVDSLRSEANHELVRTIVGACVFLLGLFIYNTCEHKTEGIFGMEVYTNSFMFSCFIMFIGGLYTVFKGVMSYGTYQEASQIDDMPISEYAKDHKA